jgi:hypothetical protein
MKYLCLVYLPVGALDGLSAQRQADLDRDSLAYDAELTRRGHFIAASALQDVATAATIRWHGGRRAVTDGPFAETKEVLGGFIFIEARDMDEALAIASEIPVGRYATIEVRPEMTIGGEG